MWNDFDDANVLPKNLGSLMYAGTNPQNQSLVTTTDGMMLSVHNISSDPFANPLSCFMIYLGSSPAYAVENRSGL